MDPILTAELSMALLFGLIMLGIHIGVALGLTSVLGIWIITGRLDIAVNVLGTTSFNAIADYVFAVVPLFVLMGLFATASGSTGHLFNAAEAALGRIRGGVGIATVAANAIFATITGVSVASAAIFSRIAIPEMRKLDYKPRFSYGIVASSSLLGMLIPPSILMIVYAILTGQSIGRMFLAGIGPGILIAVVLSASIWTMVAIWPDLAPRSTAARKDLTGADVVRLIIRPWGIYALMALVLGGLYGGFFTPTEAGAVGAAGAIVLAFAQRPMTARDVLGLLMDTARTTASIFLLLIAAQMYSRMLALSGLAAAFSSWAVSLDTSPLLIVLTFVLVIMLLGAIIDSISILLLTMPIMFPVVVGLGYDPIWFGIICIVSVEIGLLTPPFGMVIFVMKSSLGSDVRVEDIFIGAAPFILVLMLSLFLLILVPQLSLFIPDAFS